MISLYSFKKLKLLEISLNIVLRPESEDGLTIIRTSGPSQSQNGGS